MAAKQTTSVKLTAADIANMTAQQRRELLGVKPAAAEATAPLAAKVAAYLGSLTAVAMNTAESVPSAFTLAYRLNRQQ